MGRDAEDRIAVTPTDDNAVILDLLQHRMAKGRVEYGHGIRVRDDTTQYNTQEDTWVEMALEEALDMSLYLAAELLRIKARITGKNTLAPPTPPPQKKRSLWRRIKHHLGRE